MKKTLACSTLLISLFLGCKKVDNNTGNTPITPIKKDKISGLVQKGPYINGTQIVMYVLDDKLAQTGKVFNTQITDNKGSFELTSVELSSKYVQFTASGFYYNESLGAITSTQLSLNALSDVTDASSINVNILTHLEKRRVESLVKSGKTFAEAKKTAQQEIFAIFGIQIAQSAVSEKLDIATAGDANAILLAISLIIQGELSVGDMSELLATISADLEDDGVMSNTGVMAKLIANAKSLHLDSIRQNLVKRYQDLGVTATIPDFEKYINVFLVQSAQKPSAESKAATIILNHTATLNGLVNPNGAETTVTFEYGVTSSYGSSIVAKESFLYGDTVRNVSADISSLDSLTTYHYRIKAENGKGITYSADSTFTTIKDPVDLVTGLVAYFPFTGNAGDSSGNGYNGTVFNAILANDRFGKSNSAYQFNGTTSFIDVTDNFFDNGWENSTVSLWFNSETNESPAVYGGQTLLSTNASNGFVVGYSYENSQKIYVWKSSTSTSGWDILGNDAMNINPVILNEWYLVTIVKTGLNYTYYINGKIDKSFITSTISSPNTMYPIRIGGVITPLPSDNRELFTGRIDDIRIYNRALAQSEITYIATH